MGDIILQSVSKSNEVIISIRNALSHLNKSVVKNLLLIHVLGEYDASSSVFNQEKLLFLI